MNNECDFYYPSSGRCAWGHMVVSKESSMIKVYECAPGSYGMNACQDEAKRQKKREQVKPVGIICSYYSCCDHPYKSYDSVNPPCAGLKFNHAKPACFVEAKRQGKAKISVENYSVSCFLRKGEGACLEERYGSADRRRPQPYYSSLDRRSSRGRRKDDK